MDKENGKEDRMNQPILVVMAAGMGSRYGGLKQMDPVGTNGELMIDFSLYDAWRAGFKKAIFIIKREMEQDFRKIIDRGAGKKLEAAYAFQELRDLPAGYVVPDQRVKPWGTGHAVLAARHLIHQPFAVINADDFYGAEAFRNIFQFLKTAKDDTRYRYCMVSYRIENTLTDNGHVARGVCVIDRDHNLKEIAERTKIQRNAGIIQYWNESSDGGGHWIDIAEGTPVSMNFWGFTESILTELSEGFPAFLDQAALDNPLSREYFLPFVVDKLVQDQKAAVNVLASRDKWHGVTYQEDKEAVVAALAQMKQRGEYPLSLWED